MPRASLLTLGVLALAAPSPARTARPTRDPDRLLVIERSVTANVVLHAAALGPDGRLDAKDLVSAYWQMNAEHGQRVGLNLIEKAKAYGFDVGKRTGDGVQIALKALATPPIEVRLAGRRSLALTRIARGGRSCAGCFSSASPQDRSTPSTSS